MTPGDPAGKRVNRGTHTQYDMAALNYRTLLRKEPEGGYTVIVPSLPGCVTYGEPVEEGIEMEKEAIALYIESLKARGEPVPSEGDTLEFTVRVGEQA